MPSPKPTKRAPATTTPSSAAEAVHTSVLLDEIRSLADMVRGIKEDLFWAKLTVTGSDLEPIKAELRLVRHDIAELQKRVTAAAEATLAT